MEQIHTNTFNNYPSERVQWLMSHPYINAMFSNANHKNPRLMLKAFVDEINDFYEASGEQKLSFGELRYLLKRIKLSQCSNTYTTHLDNTLG